MSLPPIAPIQLVNVQPGDSNFEEFLAVPEALYPPESLGREFKNTISLQHLATLLLVRKGGKAAGRCSLYLPPGLQQEGNPAACIGHYECVEDVEVAKVLFEAAKDLARKAGKMALIGPMNGSTWNDYRLSDDHEYPNFFLEPYHHLYYHHHFQHFGAKVIARYRSNLVEKLGFDTERVQLLEKGFLQDGITFRTFQPEKGEQELTRIWEFTSKVFQSNYLYTPLTLSAFLEKYKPLLPLLEPEFISLAENETGQLVALNFCFRDQWHPGKKRLIAKTVARLPESRYAGIGQVLGKLVYSVAQQKGITSFVHAFMIDDNASNRLSGNLAGHPFKTYSLYGQVFL